MPVGIVTHLRCLLARCGLQAAAFFCSDLVINDVESPTAGASQRTVLKGGPTGISGDLRE